MTTTGWNTSKIILLPNSLRYLLRLTPTWVIWSRRLFCNGRRCLGQCWRGIQAAENMLKRSDTALLSVIVYGEWFRQPSHIDYIMESFDDADKLLRTADFSLKCQQAIPTDSVERFCQFNGFSAVHNIFRSCLAVNIMSRVLRRGRKPHWVSGRNFSTTLFNKLVGMILDMILPADARSDIWSRWLSQLATGIVNENRDRKLRT